MSRMVIRRVLLDAFGTVFSPREPVFRQYAAVARQFGLDVKEEEVKNGFKQAFKQWKKDYPLYGKHSNPPLDPSDWWSGVIQDTFRNAGIGREILDPVRSDLSSTLVHRFWGKEGYELHSDVPPFLSSLASLSPPSAASPFPPPAIVSNTDPSVSRVLRSLGVLAPEARDGIREEEVWTTWEIEEAKTSAEFWKEVLRRLRRTSGEDLKAEGVLVIGDEVDSDYHTPRAAGFRSLLLRRSPDAEHPNASYEAEKEGLEADVEVVGSLEEAVEWIRRQNSA
ncbi:hypothetical protein JCM10213_004704 [Rhodosporidiobolus nylandii]